LRAGQSKASNELSRLLNAWRDLRLHASVESAIVPVIPFFAPESVSSLVRCTESGTAQ